MEDEVNRLNQMDDEALSERYKHLFGMSSESADLIAHELIVLDEPSDVDSSIIEEVIRQKSPQASVHEENNDDMVISLSSSSSKPE